MIEPTIRSRDPVFAFFVRYECGHMELRVQHLVSTSTYFPHEGVHQQPSSPYVVQGLIRLEKRDKGAPPFAVIRGA